MKSLARYLMIVLMLIFTVTALGVEITFWHTECESERQQKIGVLVAKFEALNPDISIKVVPVEENALYNQLLTAKASKKLPTVVELPAEAALMLGNEGLLDVKLNTEIVNSFGDIYDGAKKILATSAGDEFYAVPFHAWVQGIWYRKDWFKKAGLPAPTSWYNIIQAAKYFNKPEKGIYGIVLGKAKDVYAEQVFTPFALSNGARIFTPEGKIDFNTPEMVWTLKFYKELGKYAAPGHTTWSDGRQLYLTGKTAMMFYSTYIMDDIAIAEVQRKIIKSYNPELVKNTGFAPLMVNIRPSIYGQVVGLGILDTATPEQKSAAAKFVKFLMSGDNYIYWCHMAPGGMNPTRRSIAEDPKFLDNPVLSAYGDTYKVIASGLENIEKFGYVNGKVFTEAGKITGQKIIGEAIVHMFDDGWTPEYTAKWAQKQMIQAVSY